MIEKIVNDLIDYWHEIDIMTQLIVFTDNLPPCLYKSKRIAFSLTNCDVTEKAHEFMRAFFTLNKWIHIECKDVPKILCNPTRYCKMSAYPDIKRPYNYKEGLGHLYVDIVKYYKEIS